MYSLDVNSFCPAADFMARTVIRNALFFGKDKMSNLLIPYATFTDPEIACEFIIWHCLQHLPYGIYSFDEHILYSQRLDCMGKTVRRRALSTGRLKSILKIMIVPFVMVRLQAWCASE